MKTSKVSFDFGDRPELIRLLRLHAARTGRSQKDIVARALEAYFAQEAEDEFVARVAESTFSEWDNPKDEIYNDL